MSELAEHTALFDIFGQAMENVERIARQHAFPKTNDVAVIVILGGLDQNDMKFFDFVAASVLSPPECL